MEKDLQSVFDLSVVSFRFMLLSQWFLTCGPETPGSVDRFQGVRELGCEKVNSYIFANL
jgi:hypothetical protein